VHGDALALGEDLGRATGEAHLDQRGRSDSNSVPLEQLPELLQGAVDANLSSEFRGSRSDEMQSVVTNRTTLSAVTGLSFFTNRISLGGDLVAPNPFMKTGST
jgi:hypothetical protein